MKKREDIELLAPAGSFEALVAAVQNGANAIYLGGQKFGARAFARNFDYAALKEAVDYCHLRNVKLYVTVNTLYNNAEIDEIFDYLKSVGCKISLATSTSSQTALKIMKKINLYDKFDAFVCGDDVKNGKPDPEVFLIAAKKLGLEPVDCVAFEDSINGIKSAHAAGMTTVMIPDLLEPTDEIKPMIDFLCTDLSEAIKHL